MWPNSFDYLVGFVTPDTRYPGIKQTPKFMASEDARRIPVHQEKGDIASYDDWGRSLDSL